MRIIEPILLADNRILRGRFDGLTIFFHWTTVSLVLFQFASGWSFDLAEGTAWFAPLLLWHRSAGAALWCITLLRLLWRQSYARFPAFPPNLPKLMGLAAKTSEYALYALLVMQPLTGMAQTILRGKAFPLFAMTVPVLVPKDIDGFERFHEWHEWGAWALACVVGLHALAALFHHTILRDDVLEAILPLVRRKRIKKA